MTEKELQESGVNDPPELDALDEGMVRAENTVIGCALAIMVGFAALIAGIILTVGYLTR